MRFVILLVTPAAEFFPHPSHSYISLYLYSRLHNCTTGDTDELL